MDIHKKCDKQGPILIIIKSEMGRKFGLYTFFSRNKSQNTEDSFIFSLKDNLKFVKVMRKKFYNDRHYYVDGYLCSLGDDDLTIRSDSNIN